MLSIADASFHDAGSGCAGDLFMIAAITPPIRPAAASTSRSLTCTWRNVICTWSWPSRLACPFYLLHRPPNDGSVFRNGRQIDLVDVAIDQE